MPEDQSVTDEAALVTAAQAGDHLAFGELVRAHMRHVRAFISLRAPVPHLVDEIVHDAFVHAFRRLHEFKAGTSMRAWVRAIAFHLLRAEVQRYAREQAGRLKYAEKIALESARVERQADRSGPEVEALEECVRELPDESRHLLHLRYSDALESEVIGRTLERSASWVRTTLFRLRELLRLCVEERLDRRARGGP